MNAEPTALFTALVLIAPYAPMFAGALYLHWRNAMRADEYHQQELDEQEFKELVLDSIDPDWRTRNAAMSELEIAWEFYSPTEQQIQDALSA